MTADPPGARVLGEMLVLRPGVEAPVSRRRETEDATTGAAPRAGGEGHQEHLMVLRSGSLSRRQPRGMGCRHPCPEVRLYHSGREMKNAGIRP
jgi:hypothetical protein